MEDAQKSTYITKTTQGTLMQYLCYANRNNGNFLSCNDEGKVRYGSLSKEYPDITQWFQGWSNMKEAVVFDLGICPHKMRSDIMKEAGFSDTLISLWSLKKEHQFWRNTTVAIHIEFTNGKWEDFVLNQAKPEVVFKTMGISVHAMQESPTPLLNVNVEIIDGHNIMYFICHQTDTIDFLKFYIKNARINDVFSRMKVMSESEREWDDTSKYELYKTRFQQDKASNEIWDCLMHNESVPRTITTTDQKSGSLSQEGIKSAVKNKRGNFFRGVFVCRLCSRSHATGYQFYIGEHDVKVCTFCYDEIKQRKPWGKEILVNMGGKR